MTGESMTQHPGSSGLAATFDARLPAWMTPRTIFLLLLAVSLVVDLAFGFIYKFRLTPQELDADELEYYDMASRMLAGTFELTARRTLAFPLLIAGVRAVSDSFLLLQAIVTACYSLAAPLLFLVVRKVTRSVAAGALAGLVLALWPPVIYYGVSLYSETLALPVFLLALLALPVGESAAGACNPRDWLGMIVAGVILAVATQVRPMYLIMTPFLALIILIEDRDWRRAVRSVVLAAVAFMVTTLPWSVTMTRHFHHPILITSNGGETMSGGLTPVLLAPWAQRQALMHGRNVWIGPGKWLPTYQNGYLTKADADLPYDQQDKLLKARTIAWVKAHPRDAAYLEYSKITYMWGFFPLTKNGPLQLAFGNLPTMALLGFALFCFVRLPAERRPLVRFWILPLFVTLVAVISWGSWRFRQPGDAGLIAFSAVCLLTLLAARRGSVR